MHLKTSWILALLLAATAVAKPSDAEKQRTRAERKLEAFIKEYDPTKRLAHKVKELEKDVADLDKEVDALAALDAASGAQLKAQRDTAVAAAQQAVNGAAAGKATEDLDKKLERVAKDFDPEKKNLLNADPRAIEKAKKELDELIGKLDGDAKTTYQGKRDALFQKIEAGVGDAKLGRLRKFVTAPTPVEPLAGVEAIAPMLPTWCDGVLEGMGKKLDSYQPSPPGEADSNTAAAVIFSCVDPEFDLRQQVVAAWRQKLSNSLGLTAAMNERLLKLFAAAQKMDNETAKAQAQALCSQQLKPLAEGTAAERANRSLERILLQCGNQRSDENTMRLLDIDAPGALTSELARAAVIFRVLGEGSDEGDPLRDASDVAVLNTIAFDAAAFESQLASLKLNETGQTRAIMGYFGQRARLGRFVTAIREKARSRPAIARVVFDAPAAAARDYLARRAEADRPILELVQAMEAQSGPLTGCTKKLWPFLRAELKPQAGAAVADLKISGLLAFALTLCARRDADAPGLEPIFSYFSERTTAVRGPLTAAYLAYVDAYNEAAGNEKKGEFDPGKRTTQANAPGELPAPERSPLGEGTVSESIFGHENSMDPFSLRGGGVVKAVEKKGELVKVSFRTEKYVVPDFTCVETNRIDRITPEGQIIYRRNCTRVGQHEESSTQEPVEMPAWAAEGLTAGSYLIPMWMSVNSGAPSRAWVIEAFDSKARGKRTSLFGLAL